MSEKADGIFTKIVNLIDKNIKQNYFLVVLGVVSFLFFNALSPQPYKYNFIKYLHPEHFIIRQDFGLAKLSHNQQSTNQNQANNQVANQSTASLTNQPQANMGVANQLVNQPTLQPNISQSNPIYSIFFLVMEILLTSAAIVKFLSLINIERILERLPIIEILYFVPLCLIYNNRSNFLNFKSDCLTFVENYDNKLKKKWKDDTSDMDKSLDRLLVMFLKNFLCDKIDALYLSKSINDFKDTNIETPYQLTITNFLRTLFKDPSSFSKDFIKRHLILISSYVDYHSIIENDKSENICNADMKSKKLFLKKMGELQDLLIKFLFKHKIFILDCYGKNGDKLYVINFYIYRRFWLTRSNKISCISLLWKLYKKLLYRSFWLMRPNT